MSINSLARLLFVFACLGCSNDRTVTKSLIHEHVLIDDLVQQYLLSPEPEDVTKKLGGAFSLDPRYFISVMEREAWTPRMVNTAISSPPPELLDLPCAQAIVLAGRIKSLKQIAQSEYILTIIKLAEETERSTLNACRLAK